MEHIPVSELLSTCAELLTKAKPSVEAVLAPFATRAPKQGEIFACFELFHMENYSLNYNIFSVQKQKDVPVLHTEWTPATKGKSLLPELNTYLTNVFTNDEYPQAEGEAFTAAHEAQLVAWMKECWEAAGGKNATLPTYFAFGKEYVCRDMATGEILEEQAVAAKLGYPNLGTFSPFNG